MKLTSLLVATTKDCGQKIHNNKQRYDTLMQSKNILSFQGVIVYET